MKAEGLVSSYTKAKFKPCKTKANEADIPNIPGRELDGYAPYTHIASDLAYAHLGHWKWLQASELRKIGIRQDGSTPVCSSRVGTFASQNNFGR